MIQNVERVLADLAPKNEHIDAGYDSLTANCNSAPNERTQKHIQVLKYVYIAKCKANGLKYPVKH